MIKVEEGTGGGLMKNPMPNAPSMWVAYVNVDEVKAANRQGKSLGAKVLKEVKGAGSFSIITDPTGAMLGLWQPKRAETAQGSGRGPMVCHGSFASCLALL